MCTTGDQDLGFPNPHSIEHIALGPGRAGGAAAYGNQVASDCVLPRMWASTRAHCRPLDVPMRFSVLIPTRDRLEYLVQAVESVRQQDFEDWEVIVADNDSSDDIGGYVRSLGDPRIRYVRTNRPLPVTDNWNVALEQSTGDYVLMLGDDDILLRGYFQILDAVIDTFTSPDAIYTGALLFTYPGVSDPDQPGILQTYSYAEFFQGSTEREGPRVLAREEAEAVVREFFHFRARYGFNMQFALIARRFIDSLRPLGPFFQSEFPDYYAMNVLMLRAERIVAMARPVVVIGVTPKSYGFYHSRRREADGRTFLQGQEEDNAPSDAGAGRLPGSYINDGWLAALFRVRDNLELGPEYSIDHRRYRLLQILSLAESRFVFHAASDEDMHAMALQLSRRERFALSCLSLVRFAPRRVGRRALSEIRSMLRQTPRFAPYSIPGDFRLASDVFERIDPDNYRAL